MTTPLRIRPNLPRFGAEVSGLDLTQPLSEAARKKESPTH
jgi:alpha-ketoglutarate-dependent taurine dioxygenase